MFGVWVNEKYEFSLMTDLSLLIFLVSNSVQHVSGTFLTMVGGHFNFLKKLSLVLMISTVCIQFILGILDLQIEKLILVSTCVYAIGAMLYLLKSKRILSNA